MYYNINGIPSTDRPEGSFFVQELPTGFYISECDKSPDIEKQCIRIHDLIAERVFGNLGAFNYILQSTSSIHYQCGIDAECKVCKEDFEKAVVNTFNRCDDYKLFYLFDSRNILSTLQNITVEIKYLFGLFYKNLNLNSFLISAPLYESGVQYSSGGKVISVTSVLNQIFIGLYSQLDLITKVIFEIQNPPTSFESYPKLKSSKILFGDHKKLRDFEYKDTVFEILRNYQYNYIS